MEAADEMRGWKAIADFAGVSVRTALYYADAGMPVLKLGAARCSRVVAYKADVRAWLTERARPRPRG